MSYQVEQIMGHGISLSDRIKSGDTIHFAVVWVDEESELLNRKVWRTDTYFVESLTPRQRSGMRLSAMNMCKRYADHYARTGKRFEVEEDAKKGADRWAKEVQIIVSIVEEKLCKTVFSMLRTGGLDEHSKLDLLKQAETLVEQQLEMRRKCKPLYYREIDAYNETANRNMAAEITEYFKF